MQTYDTTALRTLDRQHYMHPFTDHQALHRAGAGGARIITAADNVYVYDSDGKRYLDAMAGLWCVNIGYGRHELATVAKEQMEQLPYYNSFFQTAPLPAVRLAEILAAVTPPSFTHAFFGCSGSDANDTVLRLVRHYWQLQGQPQRQLVISRNNAYHGSTVAASALGGMPNMHAHNGAPLPGIAHIAQPYHFAAVAAGADGAVDADTFGRQCAAELEAKILAVGAAQVAAFIAEPVQGAGGVIIPPASYWPEINRICKQYDILLCADEVICGFGRTGEWFGTQTFEIAADVLTLAKGLTSGYQPLSAVMLSARVAAVVGHGEFSHGYTYSGHPVACAVAVKNIEILRDEGIIETARAEVMPYFQAAIANLGAHPLVGEARSCGLLGALELVRDKASRARFDANGSTGLRCREICWNNGLIMRAVGDTMVLSPPLIITRAQVDKLVDLIAQSLDQTLAAVRADSPSG